MRIRYNEHYAIHLYLMYTLLCVPVTLAAAWALQLLGQPLALAAMWALCCIQVFGASLLVWRRTLHGLKWPCTHISIQAPLLVSSTFLVHHAQYPLKPAVTGSITAGPSALLLATCAMLTIPEKNRSAAQQAAMDFLATMKLDQAGFNRKHTLLGVRNDGVLDWSVRQDGGELRAYASGDARAVLESCDFIWDGQKSPLTDALREQLLTMWGNEELPPLGFAMAELNGGAPSEPVFLGAMLMEHALLPQARHEVRTLQHHGYAVSLQGLEPVSAMRISTMLDCDDEPSEDDAVLTLAAEAGALGDNIYLIPRSMLPTQAVGYLKTQLRRLLYQPIQFSLLITIMALCCLASGANVSVLTLFHIMLLAQFAFAPVSPRPLPDVQPRRVLYGVIPALILVPTLCLLTSWFIRDTIGAQTGACILFMLPPSLLAGVQCARLSSTIRPTLTLLPVLFFAAGLTALAFTAGYTWLSVLFALVAGSLCAMLLHILLQFADGR